MMTTRLRAPPGHGGAIRVMQFLVLTCIRAFSWHGRGMVFFGNLRVLSRLRPLLGTVE